MSPLTTRRQRLKLKYNTHKAQIEDQKPRKAQVGHLEEEKAA
jgi:hypothetical protein